MLNKYNILKFHFFIIYIVSFFSLPITYIYLGQIETTPFTLGILFLNNLLFIIFHLKFVHYNLWFLILMPLILVNFSLGILKDYYFINILKDTLNIIMFFFKINIIIFLTKEKKYKDLIVNYIIKYAYVCLIAATITIFLFYFVINSNKFYLGITPTLSPILSYSLFNNNIFYVLLTFILIFLSGKRAIILSSIIISISHYFLFRHSIKSTFIFFLISPLFIFLAFKTPIFERSFDKIVFSLNFINTNNNLNNISGGRLTENISIIKNLKHIDLLIGKGAGFRYDLTTNHLILSKNKNNAHFMPLGFVSKYGIIIFLIFLFLIIKALINNDEPKFYIFKLILLSFLIENLFSYLIFNDKIIHFIIGTLVLSKKIKSKKNLLEPTPLLHPHVDKENKKN